MQRISEKMAMAHKKSATSRPAKMASVTFAELGTVDVTNFKRAAKKYKVRAMKTKAAARQALVDTGIYTKSGKLSSHYK